MFITKKRFEEALAAEREKALKEAEERCWRFDAERRADERTLKLEAKVSKLEAVIYQKPKKWWQRCEMVVRNDPHYTY